MNKTDVKPFCEQLAAEYPGWEYTSSKFKNKTLPHSEIWIDPSWVLHLSAEPSVKVFNHSVTKIRQEAFRFTRGEMDGTHADTQPASA